MDRSLAVFLRSLQTSTKDDDVASLLPTATTLLMSLANPLNVTLLTSQLLSQPAVWEGPKDLIACRRVFSVFYTAALHYSNSPESHLGVRREELPPLHKEKWTTAVVKGADENSPRWRHALVLGAILLGFGERDNPSLSPSLRSKLESALVTAANLDLQSDHSGDVLGPHALAFVLNHTFEILTDYNRRQLNFDLLLPTLTEAVFLSNEGLENGYWLGVIDRDVVEVANKKFNWSPRSVTYRAVSIMQGRPLVASLGPISRLISFCVTNVRDPSLVLSALDHLAGFAKTLSVSWRQNKLSEIDVSEEYEFLDEESTKTTLPTLWHVLRFSLYASVIILGAVMGRMLVDVHLSSGHNAPLLVTQCLNILRNLYFISSRLGQTSSSQYAFVNMVAIDILTQYTEQAMDFIQSIMPVERGQIPAHPADRCHDLFFFNTAEHFTFALPPKVNEDVILASAMPYLVAGGSVSLTESFEAAHSATLSVLLAPRNAEVSARHLSFYIDVIFSCFPSSLSARQFRLAFKTVVRISSPPSPLSQSQPLLPSILLETISERAKHASTKALQPPLPRHQHIPQEMPLSEQAVLTMALIDSICFLHPALLEEWLPLTAFLVNQVEGMEFQGLCQDLFWEAISSGQMDVERASVCVVWWNSKGGREQVLQNSDALQDAPVMSGVLPAQSKL